jgi:hypothetical protein
MYRNCIYCAADLGSNREVEEFPVGRRLAFDPARGRLWVVCRACERWNLSPLEERWEALEALERRYRDTRQRVSTENIGLARLPDGLELVRVGRPRRPEFAAWRYGDQFGRRRRRFLVTAAVGGGLALGLGLGSVALAGLSSALLPVHLFNMGRLARQRFTTGMRIHASDDRVFPLQEIEVGHQRIRVDPEYDGGWGLDMAPWVRTGGAGPAGRRSALTGDGPHPILTGADAVHALSILLPKLNAAGAGRGKVQKAVGLIEEAGSAERYFREVEHRARRQGVGYSPLRGLPLELRLGLEMAANEDHERTALEGELALLEQAWKEAEALAAIADDLSLPDAVRDRLRRLQDR